MYLVVLSESLQGLVDWRRCVCVCVCLSTLDTRFRHDCITSGLRFIPLIYWIGEKRNNTACLLLGGNFVCPNKVMSSERLARERERTTWKAFNLLNRTVNSCRVTNQTWNSKKREKCLVLRKAAAAAVAFWWIRDKEFAHRCLFIDTMMMLGSPHQGPGSRVSTHKKQPDVGGRLISVRVRSSHNELISKRSSVLFAFVFSCCCCCCCCSPLPSFLLVPLR